MTLGDWAADYAEELLSPLRDRWSHVQAVADRARAVSTILAEDERPLLIAAAYLHDLGYAAPIARTGFHPLDGGRYVRSLGHERLAGLVAHHSGARYEARLRGFDDYLAEFPYEESLTAQALTYCDMTTGPSGQPLLLEDRAGEIYRRYGDDHVVARGIRAAMPELRQVVASIQARLQAAGLAASG